MTRPPRGLLDWVIRLYPRAWRERYGDEFAATLEELPGHGRDWGTLLDVSKGAIAMQAQRNVVSVLKLATAASVAGLVIAAGI